MRQKSEIDNMFELCEQNGIYKLQFVFYIGCPTTYQTRQFFNNFTTNEDIATTFEADLPHCVRNVTAS